MNTLNYELTERETYILGQALQIAKNELKKVNADYREDSNIEDMENLQNLFPFKGTETAYNYKLIIDFKDNLKMPLITETIKKMGVDCKIKAVQIF